MYRSLLLSVDSGPGWKTWLEPFARLSEGILGLRWFLSAHTIDWHSEISPDSLPLLGSLEVCVAVFIEFASDWENPYTEAAGRPFKHQENAPVVCLL